MRYTSNDKTVDSSLNIYSQHQTPYLAAIGLCFIVLLTQSSVLFIDITAAEDLQLLLT